MSNHIQHIEITNFKSIRHQKIEGCKRINVFIGYPNVGKSAILEAIAALSYLTPDYYVPYSKLCRLKGSSELFHDGNYQQQIIIQTDGDNKVGFVYLNENSLDFSCQQPSSNKEGWVVTKNLRFYSDTTESIQTSTTTSTPFKVKKYQFPFYDTYNNFKTNGLTLFSPNGENLVDIIQSNKELRKEISQLFKQYGLSLTIDQGSNSIKALKKLNDETISLIPFYQMADTLQRLVFHKAAIMSNENTVLLFEEPEAHMFPPYIRMFTKDIIFDKGRNNQYFIATHSPVVLSDFLEDAREELAIHLVGYKNGETIVKTLTDNEVNEVYEFGVDLFFNIESYLD